MDACGGFFVVVGNGGAPAYLQASLTSPPAVTTGQLLCPREGSGTYSFGDVRPVVGGMSPGNSSISPKGTGATVHHLGPSDPRESPFAHLRSQLQLVAGLDSRASDTAAESDTQVCKRIKLEPPCDVSSLSSPLFYRTMYVNSREQDVMEVRSSYQDHVMELFFLENAGNLMDYVAWSKRPNVHLTHLLQSTSLDDADETKAEDEVRDVFSDILLLYIS